MSDVITQNVLPQFAAEWREIFEDKIVDESVTEMSRTFAVRRRKCKHCGGVVGNNSPYSSYCSEECYRRSFDVYCKR